jgi:beta-glucosidase
MPPKLTRLNSLLVRSVSSFTSATHIFCSKTDLGSWEDSYALADSIVAQLTLDEKIGIVKGVGVINSQCVGNTSPVPRLGIPSLCLNDGPAGVRPSKGVTGFPPAINAAATFSRRLIRARAVAIGEEFRGKGIQCVSSIDWITP